MNKKTKPSSNFQSQNELKKVALKLQLDKEEERNKELQHELEALVQEIKNAKELINKGINKTSKQENITK